MPRTSRTRDDAKMPFDGVRFMIGNWLTGAAVGVVFAVAILATDLGGLRSLMVAGGVDWIAGAMLVVAMALTFAGLYAAVAIMLRFRGGASAGPDDRADGDG